MVAGLGVPIFRVFTVSYHSWPGHKLGHCQCSVINRTNFVGPDRAPDKKE